MQTNWEQTRAPTVCVCKECGSDIWPADEILLVNYYFTDSCGSHRQREIYCKGCGELYVESQELGQGD